MSMVRAGYKPVYRPREVEFRDLVPVEGRWTQRVLVVGPDGVPVVAQYVMEKQPDGSWRIDGCVFEQSTETPPDRSSVDRRPVPVAVGSASMSRRGRSGIRISHSEGCAQSRRGGEEQAGEDSRSWLADQGRCRRPGSAWPRTSAPKPGDRDRAAQRAEEAHHARGGAELVHRHRVLDRHRGHRAARCHPDADQRQEQLRPRSAAATTGRAARARQPSMARTRPASGGRL